MKNFLLVALAVLAFGAVALPVDVSSSACPSIVNKAPPRLVVSGPTVPRPIVNPSIVNR